MERCLHLTLEKEGSFEGVFPLSIHNSGSRLWFFSLKSMEWWGGTHTFPSKDSFPLRCVHFLSWGLARESQKILASYQGLHKWTNFLDLLKFQIVFPLLPQKFWRFLIELFALVMLFLELPFWQASKPHGNQCLEVIPSAKWLTDESALSPVEVLLD